MTSLITFVIRMILNPLTTDFAHPLQPFDFLPQLPILDPNPVFRLPFVNPRHHPISYLFGIVLTRTAQGFFNARNPSITARSSILLLVVSRTAPLFSRARSLSRRTNAHPPGPGFP